MALLVDRLLQHLYRYHPEQWDAERRPAGFFWWPRDAEWAGWFTMPMTVALWMLRAPDWIKHDRKCRETLDLLRVLAAFSVIVYGGWIACELVLGS